MTIIVQKQEEPGAFDMDFHRYFEMLCVPGSDVFRFFYETFLGCSRVGLTLFL